MKKYRKILAALLAGTLAVGMIPTMAFAEALEEEEVFTGTGTGTGIDGDIVVEVEATADEIISVTIVEQNETVGIGSEAVETLPGEIVDKQSLQVDTISGATVSSTGILDAVRLALEDAGVDAAQFDVAPAAVHDEEDVPAEDAVYDVDVVVVGAGGAGMTAAINVADAGKSVLIVESQALVGGNSVRSTGGLNAAKTIYQDENEFEESAGVEKTLATVADAWADNEVITALAEIVQEQWDAYQENPEGYFDSVELFELDTMVGGKGINDPDLVAALCENSAAAIDWLESVGATLQNVSSFGGASVKRIHRPVDDEGKVISVGSYIIPILKENLEARGIDLLLNTTATSIIMEDGKAVGIEAVGADGGNVTVNAKAVILATGGFGANLEKVSELKPELDGFMTTNAPGALGQGLEMAQAVGADVVDLEQIQIHPTVQFDTATLITEGLRGDGAILVNADGERFIDEVGTRIVYLNALMVLIIII